eukprot:23264_1
MLRVLQCAIFHFFSLTVHSSCKSGYQYLPQRNMNSAIGKWNNTIYLLGGQDYSQEMYSFTPSDHYFDYKDTKLNYAVDGGAQFYTQSNHTLYMIHGHGGSDQSAIDTLYTYDMENDIFTSNAYTIPVRVAWDACLASNIDYLFVIGGTFYGEFDSGISALDLVQILELSSKEWTKEFHMNVPRNQLSCVVHPGTNTLYAVAGNNGNEDVATIEGYAINQTASNWQFTNGNLSKGVVQSRSVIYHDNIYVIGGFSGRLPSNAFSDCVHVLLLCHNIESDQISHAASNHTPDIEPNIASNSTSNIEPNIASYTIPNIQANITSNIKSNQISYTASNTESNIKPNKTPNGKSNNNASNTASINNPNIASHCTSIVEPFIASYATSNIKANSTPNTKSIQISYTTSNTEPHKASNGSSNINPSDTVPSDKSNLGSNNVTNTESDNCTTINTDITSHKNTTDRSDTTYTTTSIDNRHTLTPKPIESSTTTITKARDTNLKTWICIAVIICICVILGMYHIHCNRNRHIPGEHGIQLIEKEEELENQSRPDMDHVNVDNSRKRLKDYLKQHANGHIDQICIHKALHDFYKIWECKDRDTSIIPLFRCQTSTCKVFNRHNKSNSTSNECKAVENEEKAIMDKIYEEKAICQIMDKIHCACLHMHPNDPIIEPTCIKPTVWEDIRTRTRQRYTQLEQIQVHAYNAEQKKYDFGCEFMYEEAKHEEDGKKYIEEHHSSLKDELITPNNTRTYMTMDAYQTVYKKATFYKSTHTYKAKRSKKASMYGTVLTDEHILVLIVYTDFDAISFEFSKTYRQPEDHTYYYHFGKRMKEVVQGFGTPINEGLITEFYHGVNQELVPEAITRNRGRGVSIYCALSTTSLLMVAAGFAAKGENGVIMTLGGEGSKATYFPVAGLSKHPHEREYLFLQNKPEIQILNIQDISRPKIDFKKDLNDMMMLDRILSLNHFSYDNKEYPECTDDILEILKHQAKKESIENMHPDGYTYKQKLWNVYFDKKRLRIDCAILQSKYSDLYSLLCLELDNHHQDHWVKFDILSKLYPKITTLNVIVDDLPDIKHIRNNLRENHELLKSWSLQKMKIQITNRSTLLSFTGVDTINEWVSHELRAGSHDTSSLDITFLIG